MDETLLTTLREGIRKEITQYEQLLDLTTQEHKILAEESYSTELATLAARKLRVMRDINDLAMRIGPLKVRWKLEESREETAGGTREITPLLDELGTLLEKILDVDEANQEILARLVGGADSAEANKSLNAASAARAYGEARPKS
jgi:flagellar biosynthesis/type III secretory pathway chaperone